MFHYLYIIALLYLIVCPFTKVEESFNLQAIHDIIFFKWNLTQFDHFEFPGVVPRSFLGPLFITLILSPVLTLLDFLGVIGSHKFICQYLARGALGCCVLVAFKKLYNAVREKFGEGVAVWFLALTASQYHFMFYLSRPLPNIISLPLVLLAISYWIKQDHFNLICVSATAVIIFRFELAILLGLMILIEIIKKRISFSRSLKIGVGACIFSLVSTIALDTIFWNRLIWPEGEVFWFNVILNKSSNYGILPFFWYWYSALPRALGASITLVPFGDNETKLLLAPALIFVSVMSFLPHKELRFIIYTFPLFNISAATFCQRVWINRYKSLNYWIGSFSICLHLLANAILSCLLLRVAYENYPGGQAIMRLHQLEPSQTPAHVFIDNLSAQTGVSRFTQVNPMWKYNKTENLSAEDYLEFTHLLLEAKSKYSSNLKPFLESHEVLDIIDGFSHLHFNYNNFPPFKIKSKPMIFIIKKKIPKANATNADLNKDVLVSSNSSLEENTQVSIDVFPKNDVEETSEINIETSKSTEKEKMGLDDFFAEFYESSGNFQSKKFSANKVVKMAALKEKKPKEL